MYTTEAAVRLATGFSDTTKISKTTIESYIADADGVINSFLAGIYVIPFTAGGIATTPELIETLSRHITVGLLYANEYGEESQDTDKGWEKRMNWAMKMLSQLKKGDMKLYGTVDGILTECDTTSLRMPKYYPTEDSSEEGGPTEPKFTMDMKF